MRLLVHGDLDSFRNRKLDRVRLAKGERNSLTFEFCAVTDADNVELFLEARSNTGDGIGNKRASKAMHGAMIVRGALHVEHAILLFEGDAVRNCDAELALGALHVNFVRGDTDLYAGGNRNWFVSYTRHFFFNLLKPSFRNQLPNFAKQFSADFRLLCRATGHQALRSRDDADSKSTNDRLHVHRADVLALTRPRNALEAGDDAA